MRPLTTLGVVTVLAGFLVVFQRGLAGLFDFSYTFVTLVGVLAGVQGLRYALARRRTETTTADLGDPERRYVVDVPGAEIDDQLRRASSRGRGGNHFRRRLRDRLRAAARDHVAATRNVSIETAERSLTDGSWTDDAAAAAFLEPAIGYPLRIRLRASVRGVSTFRYGMGRTVAELHDLGVVDRDRGTDRDGGRDRGTDRDGGRDRGTDWDGDRDRGTDWDGGRDRETDRGGNSDRGSNRNAFGEETGR